MKKLFKTFAFLGLLSAVSCSKNDNISKDAAQVNEASAAHWGLSGNTVTHDPTLIQAGSTWWSFSTGQGIGVKYSSDGRNWTQGVQRFPSALSWWKTYAPNMTTNDIWAPDIIYRNGRYWLYYSVSSFGSKNSAIGLTSCTSIQNGDWRDDGLVISSGSNTAYNAIDPDVFVNSDGRVWMTFGSFFDGIQIVELNGTTMKPTGSVRAIARRSGGIEAPCIVKNGSYYYLFVSIDRCCQGTSSTYKIAYGRSTSITGPYTDRNGGSMLNGAATVLDAGNTQWRGPGGQDVYRNNIMIRHAYDANDNGTPKMLISDLYFSGGWPTY
ncbi:glycoside hydrolase family 43 protein [Pedobacter sp. SYSU D00535]|uniref:glycoside hydrolase family 43 protein n=1 Tax=Pedobacter sp. SYSU D00535 TaxID=2810308 RepID=UPI001A978A51|nr:glycoside hydrolase family 43 protein [Pedobacter sp. SYSU D00535]